MATDPNIFTFNDGLGSRTLTVPQNELPWTGDPIPIVRDIEARTRTRLRDGGNPVWFIRLHKHFCDRRDPVECVSFAEFVLRRHGDKIDVVSNGRQSHSEAGHSKQKDFPVFPFEPTSITESKFRIIEPGDMQSPNDVDELMRVMWHERECIFHYYIPKNGPRSVAMIGAKECGDILMNEMTRRFYKHPLYPRDYVEIPDRDGQYRWPWQKAVVEAGPEFWRVRLYLSTRKIFELDALYKIELEHRHRIERVAQMVEPAYLDAFKIISRVTAQQVKDVNLPLTMSEAEVRSAFEAMLGEAFHATDSGVEQCDMFSLQGSVERKNCAVAAAFKGPGNQKWPVQITGFGKRGDQIGRLFSVPADVYIIQANGPFDPSLIKHIQDTADAQCARGRHVRYMIIDGISTARLLRATELI